MRTRQTVGLPLGRIMMILNVVFILATETVRGAFIETETVGAVPLKVYIYEIKLSVASS
jgi:hypothetical protein